MKAGLTDMGFGMLGMLLVNSSLVDFPVRLALTLVPFTRQRSKVWLRQLAKASLVIAFVRYMRALFFNDTPKLAHTVHMLWNAMASTYMFGARSVETSGSGRVHDLVRYVRDASGISPSRDTDGHGDVSDLQMDNLPEVEIA